MVYNTRGGYSINQENKHLFRPSFKRHWKIIFHFRERSRGTSLVIFRFLISSLIIIFITHPGFIPLNLRLDALFWLLCASRFLHFPKLSHFPKDEGQLLLEKECCFMSRLLLQDGQALFWLILSFWDVDGLRSTDWSFIYFIHSYTTVYVYIFLNSWNFADNSSKILI